MHGHGTSDGISKSTLHEESSDYPGWLIELGHLALKLGFQSDRIFDLTQMNAELSDIRKHLRCERPGVLFDASSERFEAEALQRQERLVDFDRRKSSPKPSMSADEPDPEVESDECVTLFLPNIHRTLRQQPRQYLTSFGRIVLVLVSFLGQVDMQAGNIMETHFTPADY
ncbi:hypothetical protein K491DRAFT_685481 [Lophiostoma macrostomum CBS 122681]|uniref:Uncharacterized protein n=1 Tax=Lophiostoma macrostomum CBS 122681 TaxID=1314788 RepID=A0A6A6SI02_9PLEO|nr:hypothetical protein K491DRAFT_685481 [Lophiostoma macrostomum CBS 122681]